MKVFVNELMLDYKLFLLIPEGALNEHRHQTIELIKIINLKLIISILTISQAVK